MESLLFWLAPAASVIALTFAWVFYRQMKKHAVVYIVGAVVLFAATGILQIIKNFADNSLN